jgi:hypothetical protein
MGQPCWIDFISIIPFPTFLLWDRAVRVVRSVRLMR